MGFVYGLSQFSIYGIIATLFYVGAEVLDRYKEEPLNMFIKILAMTFGAMACG